MDPYAVLGVQRNATREQISDAYRKLARKYHPDLNPDDTATATQKFKEVSLAYEQLTKQQERPSSPFNFDEIFKNFHAEFGERPGRGKSYRVSFEITLEEAYTGCQKDVEFHREDICSTCNGSGAAETETCKGCGGSGVSQQRHGGWNIQSGCRVCGGLGRSITKNCEACNGSRHAKSTKETVVVTIPPGAFHGMQIKVANHGGLGQSGRGDLIVGIGVKQHNIFARDGGNLLQSIGLSYTQLLFGDKVEVPLMDGTGILKIPPRTESGKRFRIPKKGMPTLHGKYGDMFVDVELKMPVKLDPQQELLLKQLAEIEKMSSDKDDTKTEENKHE